MPHDHPLEYALLVVAIAGFIAAYRNVREAQRDVRYARGTGSPARVGLMTGVRTSALFSMVINSLVLGIVICVLILPPPPPPYQWGRQNLWTMLGLSIISSLLTARDVWSNRFRQKLGLGRPVNQYPDPKTVGEAYNNVARKRFEDKP